MSEFFFCSAKKLSRCLAVVPQWMSPETKQNKKHNSVIRMHLLCHLSADKQNSLFPSIFKRIKHYIESSDYMRSWLKKKEQETTMVSRWLYMNGAFWEAQQFPVLGLKSSLNNPLPSFLMGSITVYWGKSLLGPVNLFKTLGQKVISPFHAQV